MSIPRYLKLFNQTNGFCIMGLGCAKGKKVVTVNLNSIKRSEVIDYL